MTTTGALSTKVPAEKALDHQWLFQAGLESIRRQAHGIWTDHNLHDPGITILELLSYALTDLSYRAGFPLEDLLAVAEGNEASMQGQFPTARRILPNRALTTLDYRKLLVDLPGVKNAWIHGHQLTYWADPVVKKLLVEPPPRRGIRRVDCRGLYRVLIEYADHITTPSQRVAVDAAVLALLHDNRNLCEDFVAVERVARQPFVLCGEVELEPNADTAEVMAEVLNRIQEYLAPSPVNYTLAEMLTRRKPHGTTFTTQEIFEGPVLQCGFIDDYELAQAELRTEVHLSDVMSLVMDIKGVRAIREMIINPTGADSLANPWIVPVEEATEPVLDVEGSRLVFYKGGMPVAPRPEAVAEKLEALTEQARAKLETAVTYDLPIPLGRYRATGRYFSFQNHFPALYGVGATGVKTGSEVFAYQLKGFLLFFDQIMANFCAQLEGLKDLFSTGELPHTYVTQLVETFSHHAETYRGASPAQALAEMTETPAVRIQRRGRLLDHLTARYAERFHDQAAIMQSVFGLGPESLERAKRVFLDEYPELSSRRGKAENYLLTDPSDQWDTDNVSGLQQRACRLLGIGNHRRRDLTTMPVDAQVEVEENPAGQFSFRLRHPDSGKILLGSNVKEESEEAALSTLAAAVERAQLPSGFERKVAADGTHFFNVVDPAGATLARRREFFPTLDELEAAIVELIGHLRERYSREGMFVIENITLRPGAEGAPCLPICVDPNCSDCFEDDPYSYRIHIVLPATVGRFRDMDFRRFAEETIREETPAHILARICWVSDDDLARLQKAHRAWIEVRADRGAPETRGRLEALAEALAEVKNVYPTQQLRDCDSPEDEPKFILGRTALGSAEDVGG